MTVSRHNCILATLIVAAGAAALTPYLLAQSGTTQPARPPSNSAQQVRLDAALKVIDIMTKQEPGSPCPEPERWHRWQYRWMESAKALAPDAKARLKVVTEYRDLMRNYVEGCEGLRTGGYRTTLDLAAARYFLAEAEALLLQESR